MKKGAQKTEETIFFDSLPEAFCGFKIAHISDIHSRPASNAAKVVKAEKPDIIVITGDILDSRFNGTKETEALILELLAVAPLYFVTGNHDVWSAENEEELKKYGALGAHNMDGRFEKIEKNGAEIGIFGVGDSGDKNPKKISAHIKKEFSQLPEYNGFKLLLFHRANHFDEIKDLGYDLVLSGHMHGGQVVIGRLGGVLSPSSALFSGKRIFFPKYSLGTHKWGKTTMKINRGMGNTLPIPRWNNPAEIGIITLMRL